MLLSDILPALGYLAVCLGLYWLAGRAFNWLVDSTCEGVVRRARRRPDGLGMPDIVTLYDLHVDGTGCSTPKPECLTRIGRRLVGKRGPLSCALAILARECPGVEFSVSVHGECVMAHWGPVVAPAGAFGTRAVRAFNVRLFRFEP